MIAVAAAAIALVAGVTISFSSYLGEFENARTTTDDGFTAITQPVLGSQTAPITIVEVGDYQCHMCKKWFEETRPLIIENYINTGKVNLIFIDMPFLGRDSTPASEATYCADDQGKYWEYHSMLFRQQQEIDDGWANANRLQAIALNLNLDMEQFDNCMSNDDHKSRVNVNMKKAKTDFGSSSTPTFVIVNSTGDTKKIIGAHPYSTFEEVINSFL